MAADRRKLQFASLFKDDDDEQEDWKTSADLQDVSHKKTCVALHTIQPARDELKSED